MRKWWTPKLPLFVLAAAVALTGCATIQRSEAPRTEQLLAAAGFTMQPLDSAAGQQHDATPPYKLASHSKDGGVEYTYTDPDKCKCVYVGGSKEYSAYERLTLEKQLAEERVWARDSWASWNYWWPWGPWGAGW
jgi:hypothetical protein